MKGVSNATDDWKKWGSSNLPKSDRYSYIT